ncbi:DNA mismatch endonuclease Vsr [Aeromicrobium sp. S22]|nr:DNA mismatch endonuclease Vsr [Aeromicrobium sp. S22]
MSAQKRQGTLPEMLIRQALHADGYRYRIGYPVPGAPRRSIDIAFPGQKVAIFVDGCFWHGCPTHATSPKSNAEWWRLKIDRNRERDLETNSLLVNDGWTVCRLWEHEPVGDAVTRIEALLQVPAGRLRCDAGSA